MSTHPLEEAPSRASQALIQRAVRDFQSGTDRDESFRILVERFFRPVHAFFGRRIATSADVLDLTQETFLRVYLGLDGFRGEAKLSTWLFQIAWNTFREWLRRRGPHEEEIGEDAGAKAVVAEGPAAERRLLEEEERRLLRQAIEELPPQMRRCIVLRTYRELRYKEIAAALQVSIETVKAHLFQARQQLRKKLARRFEGIDV